MILQEANKMMEVKIVDFPKTKLAVLEHKGSSATEYESIKKFIAWRIENKYPIDKHKGYGVHYNDQKTVHPDEYHVDLCISINEDAAENSYGVINKTIPAGKRAMVRHLGSRQNRNAARYLHDEWQPNSREILRNFPIFFHYVNVGPGIQDEDMITDVYLPIM